MSPLNKAFVFLDIDGVILPFGSTEKGGSECVSNEADSEGFPDSCLSALSKIISITGAEIVLSSTWRVSESAMEQIITAFKTFSVKYGGPLGSIQSFKYMTNPNLHNVRQWEVMDWLAQAKAQGINVASWVALDDDDSLVKDPRFLNITSSRTVLCESSIGLTDENADSAIAILLRQNT
mmetsp:Transcript_15317/g.17335  ORF Transcript_15317/g.17335 Transcript_15317/m.17335 type:complete len:179 (+) Transcript_15317:76-612(+)|eukprot:CAMPEP_0184007266 /NCGR_PEP_ID=MMETSP0954-20121128/1219_1 /TAXON_ID=627963 /ORGANISM="Aplanochytrium sp, Strain PBS07" /LENGTH=178 /DNA_ID=CAMNT_0026286039 /DNA_START=113 /DNA_END=649 /DNA_ORIENTATION=+